jgi:hypothetical protein
MSHSPAETIVEELTSPHTLVSNGTTAKHDGIGNLNLQFMKWSM